MSDGVVEEEQRDTSGEQRHQIGNDEGSATIGIGDVGESPNISQADRRTNCSDEEGASAGETFTSLGLSSGVSSTCNGRAGLREVRHVGPFLR